MAGDKGWWDCFAEGAARAFWADAYIFEVEDLVEGASDRGEEPDHEAYDALSPGPGGEWLDYVPDTPPSALKQGRAFVRAHKKLVSADVWQDMDDKLGCDESGWYAAMGAMGHGVGLGDEGIDDSWVGYEDPSAAVRNDAYQAVRDAIAEMEE